MSNNLSEKLCVNPNINSIKSELDCHLQAPPPLPIGNIKLPAKGENYRAINMVIKIYPQNNVF
jgi:hypothetical protein